MANEPIADVTLRTLEAGSLRGLSEPIESYSTVQLFYLLRLVDLRELRAQWIGTPEGEWRMQLIDRALFSAYRAACDLGILADARHILSHTHSQN